MGDIYNWGKQHSSTFTGSIDYKKAMEYYLIAANYGYPYAQWEIARMYYLGKGVESDNEKNIEWRDKAFANFKKYAEDGDAGAMGHLVDYYNGIENDKYKDYVKAFYWAFRELEAGDPSGASEIASLYQYGKGVEKNVPNTYVWYARFCIEAKKKNWPVDQYPDYKELTSAGFSEADWNTLAAFTYGLFIPHVSVNDDNGISSAVNKILSLLASKNDDIVATVNSIKSNTGKTNSQPVRTINKDQSQNNVPFAGYERAVGKVPGVGEKVYWHKSGSLGYRSVECSQGNNGQVLYKIYPAQIDYQHPGECYLYQSQSNGWYIFRRVNMRVVLNTAAYPRVEYLTFYDPLEGQIMISTDGNTLVDMSGTRYDTPITKETANLLFQKQKEFVGERYCSRSYQT